MESRVRFKRLSRAEIEAYLDSGEWRGKAGAYAIQGLAGAFVIRLIGSYTNVVGLPLAEAAALLAGEGYPVLERLAAGMNDEPPAPPRRSRARSAASRAIREFAPFCSRRCADIDLGRWLKGGYVIPGAPARKRRMRTEAGAPAIGPTAESRAGVPRNGAPEASAGLASGNDRARRARHDHPLRFSIQRPTPSACRRRRA